MSKIFPSLVPESASDNGDEVYTKEELKDMDYDELRQMAANVDSDAINGKSTKMEIISYFAGQATMEDF